MSTFTLIVVLCFSGPQNVRCQDVELKQFNSPEACEKSRTNGKGTHTNAVYYYCRENKKR